MNEPRDYHIKLSKPKTNSISYVITYIILQYVESKKRRYLKQLFFSLKINLKPFKNLKRRYKQK